MLLLAQTACTTQSAADAMWVSILFRWAPVLVTGVVTSLLAAWIILCLERKRMHAASDHYLGEWDQWDILNGKPSPLPDDGKCVVRITRPKRRRPEVLHIEGTAANGEVWKGDAIINHSVTNRATLVWSYTEPSDDARFGTYELYRVNHARIFVEPSAVTKEAGFQQHLWVLRTRWS